MVRGWKNLQGPPAWCPCVFEGAPGDGGNGSRYFVPRMAVMAASSCSRATIFIEPNRRGSLNVAMVPDDM